nr:MAG TPA: hypothetical protein [Caudoviricetes sp.]DAX78482.1 MAG TPA: hypothetical protein [Caudoviricetes sp.]
MTYRFITCGANSRLSDILKSIISRHAPIYLCQFCYNLICYIRICCMCLILKTHFLIMDLISSQSI